MASHRFKVGDKVRMVRLSSANTVEAFLNMVTLTDVARPQDTWEIIRLLPADRSGFQYHVRGEQTGPERLVREEELQPVP